MNRYPFESKENSAKALGKNLGISTKQSINICNFVRGKSVKKAKEMLQKVSEKKMAVPFTRFNMDMGHKTGIGPGRYPIKASLEILAVIAQAEANAQFKGLNTSNLVLNHISANKGVNQWRHGRRRQMAKRTSIVVMVEEGKTEEKEKKGKKKAQTEDKKTEAKK